MCACVCLCVCACVCVCVCVDNLPADRDKYQQQSEACANEQIPTCKYVCVPPLWFAGFDVGEEASGLLSNTEEEEEEEEEGYTKTKRQEALRHYIST